MLPYNLKSTLSQGFFVSEMRIGEVAERAGLRASAVRYYESIGLLPAARRESGQRRYERDVLLRLAGIRLAQQAGFTVKEIKQLYYGFPRAAKPSERWATLAVEKLPEIEELIQRAKAMKALLQEGIRCGCTSLEECTVIEAAVTPRRGGKATE